MKRVDVFWTRKEGDDLFKDNGEDCITSCIFTVECCSSQGFPLFCISDDSFSDCCSKVPVAAGSAPDSLLVDYELGTTSITFHEPLHTGPFHYGISREEILSNGVKDNHKYRKSLRETIDELASESSPPSFENETFAWGDNANECLVSFIRNILILKLSHISDTVIVASRVFNAVQTKVARRSV